MINLTKTRSLLHNGDDLIPLKMALGKIGSSVAGLAALGAALAAPEKADAQDVVLAAAENPEIAAIMADFRTCVDGAIAATDPQLVPDVDDATRKLVFDTMVDLCDSSRSAQMRTHAANQRITDADERAEEITRSIIEGAKAEVGIKS
ncbi:MAG: hypothetical protein AB8C46_23570 [Burkholderiaceae bacterium]